MSKLSKYCKGCITNNQFSHEGPYCGIMRFNYNGQCPCSVCVIKVMCEVPCEDFESFKVVKEAEERYDRRYEL